ncbi:hypothetical protein AAMO2058_001105600 [Amorphochlora amoebiformis]
MAEYKRNHPPMPVRVGLFMKAKKCDKLMRKLSAGLGRTGEVKTIYVKLDPALPLDSQGEVDILVIKVNEWLVRAHFYRDKQAKDFIRAVESYILRHPSICVIGRLNKVRPVIDRRDIISKLNSLNTNLNVFVPRSINVSPLKWRDRGQNNVRTYLTELRQPTICKHVIACGHPNAHKMIVAPCNESLVAALGPNLHQMSLVENKRKLPKSVGWVVQELIPHDGYVYKIYVCGGRSRSYRRSHSTRQNQIPKGKGEYVWVARRESFGNLRSLKHHGEAVMFHSHEKLPQRLRAEGKNRKKREFSTNEIEPDLISSLKAIGKAVSRHFEVGTVGIDVLLSPQVDGDHRYYVIDVNYLPSYKEVDDREFRERFDEYLLQLRDSKIRKEKLDEMCTCRGLYPMKTGSCSIL